MTTNEQYRQAAFHLTPPETRAPDSGAPSPVERFTPRDAAKALIRPYVLRGDPLDSLKGSLMGSAGADFAAQIGGSIAADGKQKKVKRDQIGISRIGAEPVAAIFSLSALYKEVQAEADADAMPLDAVGGTDRTLPTEKRPEETTPAERIDRDPDVLPNRRLPHDFWPEFQAEWAFRERNGLPAVSPSEFVDMRDFADGIAEPRDARWRWEPERPAYPEWEPVPDAADDAGWDEAGEEAEALADAPRDDRFRREGRTVFDARQARVDATIAVLAKKVEEMVTGEGYRASLFVL